MKRDENTLKKIQAMKKQPGEKSQIETPTMQALINERMKKRKIFVLERTAPTRQAQDVHTSLLVDHVTATLQHQLDEISTEAEESVAAAQPLSTSQDFGGLQTEVQLHHHFLERLYVMLNQPMKTLDFTVPTGSRVFGTPYDVEWQMGGGFAFGSRADGSLITVSVPGFSAAAVGFYLSSPEPLLAAITPMGSYDFNWFSLEDLPSVQSRGGLGITVYLNEDHQPIQSRQAVLWSLSGITRFTADKGTGRIADAASPAFGFGPVPLAPIFVQTGPNLRYLVWVWCWQICQRPSESAFMAFLQLKMPFVTVNAGPPIVIH